VSRPEPDIGALTRLTQEREGTSCIYREFRLTVHARVEKVSTSDWGVKLAMMDLESPGFLPSDWQDHPHRWKASANWEYFHHGGNVWSMSYGWTLYLDTDLVSAVVETARSVAEEDAPTRFGAIVRSIHDARWPQTR